MPVAAVEQYSETKDRPGTSRRRRKSSTICTTSLEGEANHPVALAFRADDQANASTFIQCHSPILDLSPNMSPESQPNSASPVFELLDSTNRRTVQGTCMVLCDKFELAMLSGVVAPTSSPLLALLLYYYPSFFIH